MQKHFYSNRSGHPTPIQNVVWRLIPDFKYMLLVSHMSTCNILEPYLSLVETKKECHKLQICLNVLALIWITWHFQKFDLEDNDMVLLTLYRTRAIVSPLWPEREITENSISADAQRMQTFTDLLRDSSTLAQYQALGKLLTIWPELEAVKER